MTGSYHDQIAAFYDQDPQHEWERMERHRTEFAVTLRALQEYLPPPPAAILDCGGGPGRYAIELARRGYAVILFDLSEGNLALARQKAEEAGVTLAGYEHGSALDLVRFADQTFDAVLLLGPLYHLVEEAERCWQPLQRRRGSSGGRLAVRAALPSMIRFPGVRWDSVPLRPLTHKLSTTAPLLHFDHTRSYC